VQWDLTTIEHHADCPFGAECSILEPIDCLCENEENCYHALCVWCFALAQAEFTSNHIRDIIEGGKARMANLRLEIRSQSGLRWDAYDQG